MITATTTTRPPTKTAPTTTTTTITTITFLGYDSNLVFIKIGSIKAEIFQIWANVVWTNVNLIIGICSTGSFEATFKVSSKWGQ